MLRKIRFIAYVVVRTVRLKLQALEMHLAPPPVPQEMEVETTRPFAKKAKTCALGGCMERAKVRAGRLLTPYCAKHAALVEKEFAEQLNRYTYKPKDRGVS